MERFREQKQGLSWRAIYQLFKERPEPGASEALTSKLLTNV
jgi:hypothetical protein